MSMKIDYPDGPSPKQAAEIQARGNWGGKLEFILTCVGYAVGLGNVWRFPYLTYQNGGGAFLIPYLVMLLLVGVPVFFFELSFGQFASLGPISIWTVSPVFKGVGVAMVATSWMVGLYYTIIVAWSFYYLFASFTSVLPWTYCENDWNTNLCIMGDDLRNLTSMNTTDRDAILADKNATSLEELKSPSEEYFYRNVLHMSEGLDDGGTIVWQLSLCLLLTWFIVFVVLLNGIKSLGKVIYFVATFPYLMLTILVIRGATLPGAMEGVKYYLNPDMEKLANPTVWSDAATMVFYSLSACSGGLIAMSSYNQFKNNCLRDSIIVPTVTGFTSVYSGFAIFTVLGFMAHQKGVDVSQVAAQGPGLTFVVYPEALTQMPLPPLWSILFFVMLLSLGFSSLFSIVESVFVAAMDEFPDLLRVNKKRPIIFRAVCITIYFFITLPMVSQNGFYLFSLTDNFVSGFPLLFIGMFELSSVSLFYGYSKFAEDIEIMLGSKPSIFFKISWVVLTPLILLVCIIAKSVDYEDFSLEGYTYPAWGQALGWLQVAFILIWIPAVAIGVVWKEAKLGAVFRKMANPDPIKWGPASMEDRIGTKYEHTIPQQLSNTDYPMDPGNKGEMPSVIPMEDAPDYDDVINNRPDYDASYSNPGFDSYELSFRF